MPSIVNGLFAGRSGVQGHGSAISVLADNIANTNTVGFKASRPEFVDLLAGNLSGAAGGLSIGSGSNLANVTTIFNQGTLEFSGRGLDLAIDGNGFFVVADDTGRNFFTRAGNFGIDKEGFVVNQNGLKVQGSATTGSGGLGPLNVNVLNQQSVETENVTITGNLDAEAEVLGVPPGAGVTSFQTINAAANFSTFVNTFDSLGNAHSMNFYFFKTADNTWTVQARVDGAEIVGETPGEAILLGSATLAFNGDGSRTTSPAFDIDLSGANAINWTGGAQDGEISILFSPFTQFSTNSNVSSINQDGEGVGSITSFSVEENGSLFALLDNGQTATIGTIQLATFANLEGLRRTGESLFVDSASSGEPVFGSPQSGQFGAIQSGAIELSTADLAADFVSLISLQRGFQSSARIITNIDDLLQEIVNLA